MRDLITAMENFFRVKTPLIERVYRDYLELMMLLETQDEEIDEIWTRNQSRIQRLALPLQLEKSKQLATIQSSEDEKCAEKLKEIEQFGEQATAKKEEALQD